MSDLVGTCPKGFWEEWIAEGDAAGDPATGQRYGWYTRSGTARYGQPGDRFYVVAHGKLRGWAPIEEVTDSGDGSYCVLRAGGAVACTLAEPVPGFRGVRMRWWKREDEIEFPDWRTP